MANIAFDCRPIPRTNPQECLCLLSLLSIVFPVGGGNNSADGSFHSNLICQEPLTGFFPRDFQERRTAHYEKFRETAQQDSKTIQYGGATVH